MASLPERDHPALLLLLFPLLLAPSMVLHQLGEPLAWQLAIHALGVALLAVAAFLVLGLADTGLAGFVGVAGLSAWAANAIYPPLAFVLAPMGSALVLAGLVSVTRGMSRSAAMAASLLVGLLLLEALPTPIRMPGPDWPAVVPVAIAAAITLAVVMASARSTAGDTLRLWLYDREDAASFGPEMATYRLVLTALGGAIAALGCVLLEMVGWSVVEPGGSAARHVVMLAAGGLFLIAGQDRLSGFLVAALPLLVLPMVARVSVPGLPDPTLPLLVIGVAAALWLGRSRRW